MPLHLSLIHILGLAFAFTALCMQAIFGCKDGTVLPVRLWLPLAVFGILLAPAKLVYLPLAALFLLIPNSRFGQSAATKKAAYLAGCVLLALSINRAVLVLSLIHIYSVLGLLCRDRVRCTPDGLGVCRAAGGAGSHAAGSGRGHYRFRPDHQVP